MNFNSIFYSNQYIQNVRVSICNQYFFDTICLMKDVVILFVVELSLPCCLCHSFLYVVQLLSHV